MRRTGGTGNRMEETLFGVERGLLTGITLTLSWDGDACNQAIAVIFCWQNRKPSAVYVYMPDELQIAHFIAIWMPVVMHGQWQSRGRFQGMVKSAIARCEKDGAEIKKGGTRFVG